MVVEAVFLWVSVALGNVPVTRRAPTSRRTSLKRPRKVAAKTWPYSVHTWFELPSPPADSASICKKRSQTPKWQRLWSPTRKSWRRLFHLSNEPIPSFWAQSLSLSPSPSPAHHLPISHPAVCMALLCISIAVWHFVLSVSLFAHLSPRLCRRIMAMASSAISRVQVPPAPTFKTWSLQMSTAPSPRLGKYNLIFILMISHSTTRHSWFCLLLEFASTSSTALNPRCLYCQSAAPLQLSNLYIQKHNSSGRRKGQEINRPDQLSSRMTTMTTNSQPPFCCFII